MGHVRGNHFDDLQIPIQIENDRPKLKREKKYINLKRLLPIRKRMEKC